MYHCKSQFRQRLLSWRKNLQHEIETAYQTNNSIPLDKYFYIQTSINRVDRLLGHSSSIIMPTKLLAKSIKNIENLLKLEVMKKLYGIGTGPSITSLLRLESESKFFHSGRSKVWTARSTFAGCTTLMLMGLKNKVNPSKILISLSLLRGKDGLYRNSLKSKHYKIGPTFDVVYTYLLFNQIIEGVETTIDTIIRCQQNGFNPMFKNTHATLTATFDAMLILDFLEQTEKYNPDRTLQVINLVINDERLSLRSMYLTIGILCILEGVPTIWHKVLEYR